MTQRQTVLEALRLAGARGICIGDLPLDIAYTTRNRISELRAQGIEIQSEPCRLHQHRSAVARYRLAPVGQLALL